METFFFVLLAMCMEGVSRFTARVVGSTLNLQRWFNTHSSESSHPSSSSFFIMHCKSFTCFCDNGPDPLPIFISQSSPSDSKAVSAFFSDTG